MAERLPLVIVDGVIQQLQPGDTLAGVGTLTTKTNGNAGAIVLGQPVYADSPDNVDLARANTLATKEVIGLVNDISINPAEAGSIALDGNLVATTAQWDIVTGQVGGLTTGLQYYLSPTTAGMLTFTVPVTTTEFIVPIGVALSTTELALSFNPTILL